MKQAPETPLSQGELKVQQYVERIQGGESKESIIKDLPQSFVTGIEAGLASSEQKKKDQQKIAEVRQELGLEPEESDNKYTDVTELVQNVSTGRKQAVVDLYQSFLNDIDNPETRAKLASGLFQDVYNKYRVVDYPIDPKEEEVWEEALASKNIPVNNKKKEWQYRGYAPSANETTLTRGSLNVRVEPELISKLDEMIVSGKINGNYKFGQPGTSAAPTERFDSISIYFIEEPSEETLKELGEIIQPYVRGNNLLGKKVAEGFYMSEIGNIESDHVEKLISDIAEKDKALSGAIKSYTTPQHGGGDRHKMSEAQYYAIKDVINSFGYSISYNKDSGFEIK